MDNDKLITIIKYQESVIIRGVEKKLKERDYEVYTIDADDMNEWRRLRDRSDLFILFLPNDVSGNINKDSLMKDFNRVLSDVGSASKKAIIIGDEDDKSMIYEKVTSIWSNTWINRPFDVKKLLADVAEVFSEGDDFGVQKHILIVDDDPSYAKIVRGWLKDDYNVDVVTAGMQAITFLSRSSVDMILLDYEMPIVDGPQVLEMLRMDPTLAEIPVIFLTGVDSIDAVKRATHLKPDGYILKSTSRGDLMMYIKSVFQKYRKMNANTD